MRIFTMRLRDFWSRSTSGKSCTPRDVLFDAQLPFLKPRFGEWLQDIERPTDGGPYVFKCSFGPKTPISQFRSTILDGNWGAFEVKDIRICCRGIYNEWPTADVLVDLA